ncbi:MAG: metallophosphoesterase [Gemmataceae bacterium]|nr:metallophosphoesterase [Gemmataceae bacterium]MCI0737685.1 metallophosphoesterase [Gemmataceae bacterium]
MVLHNVVSWMRREALHRGKSRFARWLGRSWARLTYATRVEPTWLEVNHLPIPIADLPPAFAGFRIAHLTDFHGGRRVTPGYLAEAVELAHAQEPDVIVLTGDFVHKGFRHVDPVTQALGKLRAPLGVYAVLGNHDYSVRSSLGIRRHQHLHRAVADALAYHGIRVLRNEALPLTRGEHQLYLAGVEDLWSRVCDLERALGSVPAGAPCVVLAHNPCTVEKLGSRRCDLMLSGHTHGGQVLLPGVGRVALGPKGRRFAAGIYQVAQTALYVNKGIGFGLPIRYGVRPEVAVLTLQTR